MKKIFTTIAALGIAAAAMAATPASYPGGEKAAQEYIESNLHYPAMARENGVEGVVTVSFTVNADGSLSGFKIKRMVDPDLETEALRLVKGMPKWTPAKNDAGTPVASPAEIKVPFILE